MKEYQEVLKHIEDLRSYFNRKGDPTSERDWGFDQGCMSTLLAMEDWIQHKIEHTRGRG